MRIPLKMDISSLFFNTIFGLVINEITKVINLQDIPIFQRKKVKAAIKSSVLTTTSNLLSYLKNEKINDSQIHIIISEIKSELEFLLIDSKPLFEASLSPHILYKNLYSSKDTPQSIRDENLLDVYKNLFIEIVGVICQFPSSIKNWERNAWETNYLKLDEIIKKIEDLPRTLQKNVLLNESDAERDIEHILQTGRNEMDNSEWANALTFFRKALLVDPENTDALLNKAICLLKTGKLDDCQVTLDKLLKNNSLLPKPYQLRGQVYFDKTMYDYALREVDKSIGINNQIHDPIKRVEQEKNYQIKGMIYQARGFFELALENYEKALQIDPDYPSALNNKALCLKEVKQTSESIEILSELISRFPEEHTYLNNRGTVFDHLGEYASAEKDYRSAIEIACETESKPHINLAILQSTQGKKLEALKTIEKAISIDPEEPLCYFNKGVILFEQQKYEDAEKNYKKALNLSPYDELLLHNIAMLYTEMYSFDEALLNLKKVPADKRDYVYYYSIGTIYLRYGDYNSGYYNEAIKSFDKAIELNPGFDDAFLNRCAAFRFSDQYAEALKDIEYLISKDRTAEYLSLKGNILYSLGKHSEAKELLYDSIELDPNCANAYAILSHMYMTKSQLIESFNLIEKALSIETESHKFLNLKAVILMKLGDPDFLNTNLEWEGYQILLGIHNSNSFDTSSLINICAFLYKKGEFDALEVYIDKARDLIHNFSLHDHFRMVPRINLHNPIILTWSSF